MKKKIIAIVISVVIVTGAGTGIGIFVKQSNDKNTQELINAAVSQALATTESTATAESTTEETTTEESTTRKHLGAPQPTTTTTATTTEVSMTSSTAPAIVYNTNNAQSASDNDEKKQNKNTDFIKKELGIGIETPLGYVNKLDKHKDELGYYWVIDVSYEKDPNSGILYSYFIDEDNKIFIFDDNGKREYPDFN